MCDNKQFFVFFFSFEKFGPTRPNFQSVKRAQYQVNNSRGKVSILQLFLYFLFVCFLFVCLFVCLFGFFFVFAL